ncbi:MAG TPA: hypothetical protein PLJ00_09035 [Chitinophagales bacterium]|nr:hypothetical protein [Chitinophagales bacterium]HRG28023.1 hypothetical protein [Chitinophagales bacterium]HRG87170.1 hypothetical protein [Chitinophagales bacterium]HRH54026.1 hypothetical protein [Chitinophagales bacterium]
MMTFLLNIMLMSSTSQAAVMPYAELPGQCIQLPGDLVEVVYYYPNGKIKQVGFLENGNKTGEWVSYNLEGQIVVKAYFENNLKEGKWKVYNDEGELQYKIQYRNGKKVWAQEYDESGNTTAFNYK